jgi:cbb3-type cytochrome oxidase subunit 3
MMVRRMASSVLCFEVLVILFFALVAMKLSDLGAGTVWAVSGPGMVLAALLCGMLRKPWAYQAGWVLQAGLIVAGFVVVDMFFIGGFFALIWYWALKAGGRIDAEKAAAYAAYEAAQAEAAGSREDVAPH